MDTLKTMLGKLYSICKINVGFASDNSMINRNTKGS